MAQFTITTTALGFTGKRRTVTFTCPDSGGAVRFSGGAWNDQQACENLHMTGRTLSASTTSLPNVIRRELASRRRANALANA